MKQNMVCDIYSGICTSSDDNTIETIDFAVYDWVNEKRRNDELQKIQLETELNFLKTRTLHPQIDRIFLMQCKEPASASELIARIR